MAARGGGGCSHPGCGQQIGVSEAAGAGLMRCTKCRQKVYCSKACQVAGWKGGHKQECERLLGHFHSGQGEHDKAIEEHEQARAIAVELGDRESEGIDCHNMGLSYTSLKQYDKAIELLEQSLAIEKELGNKRGQAETCRALGRCLSRHGQHDRAVACLKHAWAVYQQLGNEENQVRAANALGEALWARARAEHHQAAPDATSRGGVSAASADTLQEAETWLRTALDLALKIRSLNSRMDAEMHLAYVAMMKGDEDEAVELLSQHLQGWVDNFGSHRCAGCWQVRGEDAPMLSCKECRVARCVYAATPVLCGREWHACRGVADREAWMGDAGTAMRSTSGWRGGARLRAFAMASRTRASARC